MDAWTESDYAERLTGAWVERKGRLLAKHGTAIDPRRTATAFARHAGKAAKMLAPWHYPPRVAAAAAFHRALRLGHPGGPQPVMLASRKYMTQALADYLGVPSETVEDKQHWRNRKELVDSQFAEALERLGDDPCGASGDWPVEFRFLACLKRGRMADAGWLAGQVIDLVEEDAVAAEWLESHGLDYGRVATVMHAAEKERNNR
jgi:hypothetical protein